MQGLCSEFIHKHNVFGSWISKCRKVSKPNGITMFSSFRIRVLKTMCFQCKWSRNLEKCKDYALESFRNTFFGTWIPKCRKVSKPIGIIRFSSFRNRVLKTLCFTMKMKQKFREMQGLCYEFIYKHNVFGTWIPKCRKVSKPNGITRFPSFRIRVLKTLCFTM